MGYWGITAFETDAGWDTLEFLRAHLPADGKADLGALIKALCNDSWNEPESVTDGCSHTSPMAMAEILLKFVDGEISDLDYDMESAPESGKFGSLSSITASRESLNWLRDYLSDTLRCAKDNAEYYEEHGGEKWGGWFEEKNWLGWQKHMESLITRFDGLLDFSGDSIELTPSPPESEMTATDRPMYRDIFNM